MTIKRYKRGGDPRHLIDYEAAPGQIKTGRMGTDIDAPVSLERSWSELLAACGEIYGQGGLSVTEIRWSHPKEEDAEEVLIIGTVPHWSGSIKAHFPKFAIRIIVAFDEVQGQVYTRREYPEGLERLGEIADQIKDSLGEFVRTGTSQLSLGFGREEHDGSKAAHPFLSSV